MKIKKNLHLYLQENLMGTNRHKRKSELNRRRQRREKRVKERLHEIINAARDKKI